MERVDDVDVRCALSPEEPTAKTIGWGPLLQCFAAAVAIAVIGGFVMVTTKNAFATLLAFSIPTAPTALVLQWRLRRKASLMRPDQKPSGDRTAEAERRLRMLETSLIFVVPAGVAVTCLAFEDTPNIIVALIAAAVLTVPPMLWYDREFDARSPAPTAGEVRRVRRLWWLSIAQVPISIVMFVLLLVLQSAMQPYGRVASLEPLRQIEEGLFVLTWIQSLLALRTLRQRRRLVFQTV